MNLVVLHGRLGRDPELHEAKTGTEIVTFSLATNDGWGDNKRTNWHRCKSFGKRAGTIAKYLSKGDAVMVRGSVDYREWTDNEGTKKTTTEILVDDFDFVATNKPQDEPSAHDQGGGHSFGDVPF